MKKVLPLLCILLLPAAHAGERVAAVLQDQRSHGYVSPLSAMTRLRAAEDAPGASAPQATRRAYHAAMAAYATLARRPLEKQASLDVLEAMARREGCRPCHRDALLVQAQAALAERDIDGTRRLLQEAARLIPPDDEALVLQLHLVRARYHDARGELPQGIAESVAALELAERQGNLAEKVRAMAVMIGLNADLGDYARAEALARDAYALAERNGFRYMMAHVRMQQGYVYALREQHAPQQQALLDSLRIAGDDPGLAEVRVVTMANLADYHLRMEQPREALDYATRAEAAARQIDDENGRAVALANMGIALSHMGDHARGIALLKQACDVAEAIGVKNYVVSISDELVTAYEAAGQLRDALATMRHVAELNQEMTRQERDRAVLELQERYAAEQRGREIERLSATNRLKQAEVDARTWQQRMWAAVATALLVVAVALLRWLRRARTRNDELSGDIAVLAEQTMHDPMTGVFNRRHGQALMDQYLATRQSGLSVAPVGLILLDVDFFKRVNDTHGHPVGDAVLIEIASRLRSLVRQHDAVVRWGGEEFALLLPGLPGEGLAALSKRMLAAVADTPVRVGERELQITVSAGCVAFPVAAEPEWEQVLQIADLALYLSKAGGRNRATCVVRVAPDADRARLDSDLAAAHAAGDVELAVVCGPQSAMPADAAVADSEHA